MNMKSLGAQSDNAVALISQETLRYHQSRYLFTSHHQPPLSCRVSSRLNSFKPPRHLKLELVASESEL
jgi:hypothetical protein